MQSTSAGGFDLSHHPATARGAWRQRLSELLQEEADGESRESVRGSGSGSGVESEGGASSKGGQSEDLQRIFSVLDNAELSPEQLRDALSTELMRRFRDSGSKACFGVLYELNWVHLHAQVAQRLRRYQSRADAGDLLQEVFFNIYRYPRNFDAGRPEAFRVWTATIVRNTVLKHLRSLGRSGRAEVPFEDLSEHPESNATEPLGGVIEQESEQQCRRVYLIYLHLYLHFYRQLSEREQSALSMVEVDELSYREAADRLEIKLENLKMVIFRARRKIYRAMRRVFEGLPPDFRPAREPAIAAPRSAFAGFAEVGEIRANPATSIRVENAGEPPGSPSSQALPVVEVQPAPRIAISRRPGTSVAAEQPAAGRLREADIKRSGSRSTKSSSKSTEPTKRAEDHCAEQANSQDSPR